MTSKKNLTNNSGTDTSLQSSRKRTLSTYSKRLAETDQRMGRFIQQAINQTTRAYHTTMVLYVISYSVLILTILIGLLLIFLHTEIEYQFTFSVLCLISGTLGLIFLQSRNPIKNVRYLANHLVKLNVIFSAFTRQINQVDAVFEDMFTGEREINPVSTEQMLNHLQDAMAEAMSAISQVSIDMDV